LIQIEILSKKAYINKVMLIFAKMLKLFSILLFIAFNIAHVYCQGFTTHALNLYSGGLSNDQSAKLNMALWFKENAD